MAPAPGRAYSVSAADYSQIGLRIMAQLSGANQPGGIPPGRGRGKHARRLCGGAHACTLISTHRQSALADERQEGVELDQPYEPLGKSLGNARPVVGGR